MDPENKHGYQGGQGWIDWEFGTDIYMLLYFK